MESSFGEKLKVVISGGSHEPYVRVSITGLPGNFVPDMDALQVFMNRRAPGNNPLASSRKEADVPVLKYDSGIPRTMIFEIANTDARPGDYDRFRNIPRPGHADYTARLRYGDDFDMSGGGPFSGRMTAPLCVAGGLALQVLAEKGIAVTARLVSAGGSSDIDRAIALARDMGDSVGGIVQCTVEGLPAGIGDAMYGGLESRLAPVLFGIPAVKGVDFGAGFESAHLRGSENNDQFYCDSFTAADKLPVLKTYTNNCGGILGGITTGMPLTCRVAFKPTPSIAIPQKSVDLRTGQATKISAIGRHDPCVALRAVPAVEAAVALSLLDAIMATGSTDKNSAACDRSISDLRKNIDYIDSQLLSLFETRLGLVAEIGKIKKSGGIPVYNVTREKEILDRIRTEASPDFAPYAEKLYSGIFSLSRELQHDSSRGDYGLIGHPLGHSYSSLVHQAFDTYSFDLFDLDPDEMTAFVSARNFKGLTVTRPYKQDVIPLCDRLTDRAEAIGAVNTLYWQGNTLVGHNTDYDGFLYTARRSGIDFADKNVLILGTGGTSKTVAYSVRDQGAHRVWFASRNGSSLSESQEDCTREVYSYDELSCLAEQIDLIVNTTPVGTYPDNLKSLISLKDFPSCQAVIDVIYNPAMTPLLMEAKELGLKWADGLPMIVAQAAEAAECFTGLYGGFTGRIEDVLKKLENATCNIVLIGMPGCGKSTAGRLISQATGRTFIDIDDEIAKAEGCSIHEIFTSHGEQYFRALESELAEKFGAGHGQVIAAGGGIVLKERNYMSLKQNGYIICLTRATDELPLEGRPLSESRDVVRRLYSERHEMYKKWADCTVDSDALLKIFDV